MQRMQKSRIKKLLFLAPFVFFSCASSSRHGSRDLKLLFAGDIMAHTQNYSMERYSDIWDDIRSLTGASDYAFANLEAPVDASRPFESYPTFNMKPSYPEAALDAGFNLISLANNHTNDQGSEGIAATQKWAESVSAQAEGSPGAGKGKGWRRVFFSGIVRNGDFSFAEFYWREYKILFIAGTEILNTWKNYSEVNYIPPTKKGRTAFLRRIGKMKEEKNPDLFIVSIHTGEDEYVMTVRESVKDFYHSLLEAGADIVISNHPHVIRPVELVGDRETKRLRKAIMYANGNTISGQRRALDYENPADIWQYTGDGQLVSLDLSRDEKGFFIKRHAVQFITTYTPEGSKSPVVKRLDETFTDSLKEKGEKEKAKYYSARMNALKKIQGYITWQ